MWRNKPFLFLQEPCLFWKEPYLSWKESCIFWTESCVLWKEPYWFWKESYLYIYLCMYINIYIYILLYIYTYYILHGCIFVDVDMYWYIKYVSVLQKRPIKETHSLSRSFSGTRTLSLHPSKTLADILHIYHIWWIRILNIWAPKYCQVSTIVRSLV